MKIAILGTRGIPNYHGGFEQFAEFFAVYAHQEGHEVYVYNSHSHPFKDKIFKGVNIIHCYDPEEKIGAVGQFFYDLNCIRDSRNRKFDIILQLGYTSNSVWYKLLPKKAIIVTNMDGLEWKRSKYSKKVQKFLKHAERWAAKSSNYLISDSIGIQEYIKDTYSLNSEYIAYGANTFTASSTSVLLEKGISPKTYFCLIARMEPENNIETILDGYVESNSKTPFYVIGNYKNTTFGKYLKEKYARYNTIIFYGAIYDLDFLNHLRYYSKLYFHGHSVGGTNPSLLEAMASGAIIVAHNNVFNKAILEEDALYFKQAKDVAKIIQELPSNTFDKFINNNFEKIEQKFSWPIINKKYLVFLENCFDACKK